MRANEFVKIFGLQAARDLWIGAFNLHRNDLSIVDGYVCWLYTGRPLFQLTELKSLIDAHDLVNTHGLEKSKEIVTSAPSDEHFYSWTLGNSGVKDKTVNIGELRKAIADVESCL